MKSCTNCRHCGDKKYPSSFGLFEGYYCNLPVAYQDIDIICDGVGTENALRVANGCNHYDKKPVPCAQCQRPIAVQIWFAREYFSGDRASLCSGECKDLYEKSQEFYENLLSTLDEEYKEDDCYG